MNVHFAMSLNLLKKSRQESCKFISLGTDYIDVLIKSQIWGWSNVQYHPRRLLSSASHSKLPKIL